MNETLTRPPPQPGAGPAGRRRPRLSTTVACAIATAAWIWVVADIPFVSQRGMTRIGIAVVAVIPAIYLLVRDWMGCPRGREAVLAMRIGIQIGKLKRQ